ncbi:MAG: hypothetical protein ACI87J_001260 [Colwellia sp.]|jgi:hypothetical protein
MVGKDKALVELAAHLEKDLLALYGSPILTTDDLQMALGYRSIYALRQAIVRKTIPVKVFTLPNRRNKYALVKDIAFVLAKNSLKEEGK